MASRPSEVDWNALRTAADQAAHHALAPHSGLTVGAAGLAVIDDQYVIVSGCNVESASYGCTLCAECGLVSALVLANASRLLAVSITNGAGVLLAPCGRCRQLLFEVGGPDVLIDQPAQPIAVGDLLPLAFAATDLEIVS